MVCHTMVGDSLLYGPVESIKCQNAKFSFKTAISSTLDEELNQFRDMFTENGHFLNLSSAS